MAVGARSVRVWRAVRRYVRMYVAPPRYRRGQRLTLTTADRVRLNAWRLPGPDDAPCTVVVVHGFVNSSRSPEQGGAERQRAHRHAGERQGLGPRHQADQQQQGAQRAEPA